GRRHDRYLRHPVAAVLLAVELLLFEWKPRSLVPVALASAGAVLVRPYLLGPGPLFGIPPHAPLGLEAYLGGGGLGVLAGGVRVGVWGGEALVRPLRVHWMWWPALGGLVVGVGGYFEPRAMGVGYDVIRDLLYGRYVLAALVPLLLVKAIIWSASLGS